MAVMSTRMGHGMGHGMGCNQVSPRMAILSFWVSVAGGVRPDDGVDLGT